jgi:hypothetical protein
MKKIIILFTSLFFLSQTYGTTTIKPPKFKASDILIPIGNTGRFINLDELSVISLKDLQQLTGKNLKFSDKITFKMVQRKLRRSINEDGTINNTYLKKACKNGFFNSHPFHAGGFLLGFFLSLIGVLISYLINDDLKPDRTYWAWRGCLSALLLALAILGAADG